MPQAVNHTKPEYWDDKLPSLASALREIEKEKKSRRLTIILMFLNGKQYSCAQVTEKIMSKEKIDPKSSIAHYLSGSVTTILAKLVKDNVLQYAKEKTGRDGHIYEINKAIKQFPGKINRFPNKK